MRDTFDQLDECEPNPEEVEIHILCVGGPFDGMQTATNTVWDHDVLQRLHLRLRWESRDTVEIYNFERIVDLKGKRIEVKWDRQESAKGRSFLADTI